jgi:DNA polymerase III epsilon subunit-like protein
MITTGTEPRLECSSKGDKRFSAFYARIHNRNNKTIEEIYQASKVFEDGSTNLSWREAKGRKAVNMDECSTLYSKLWDEYFSANPDLLTFIKTFNGFTDIFGQPGHCCQATEVHRIANQSKMTPKHYIAIDTETGGLDPSRCALLSISCVSSRGPTFSRHIYPPQGDVDARAAEVSGYTPEKWIERGAVPLKQALDEMREWFKEVNNEKTAEVVAHNAKFDQDFIHQAVIRTGFGVRRSIEWTCTKKRLSNFKAKRYMTGTAKLDDLGTLSGFWQLEPRLSAHDALQDARCCLHGAIWLDEQEKINTLTPQ